ncbi:hypothetical protein ERHA55_51760 (plasmid) [Erwinia rhapontici]|nr:hypothetical protein [Erwinia rhapontici]BCQ47649.1 hypothetical protein ERHA55_51760 [Erwinia rhapontici]
MKSSFYPTVRDALLQKGGSSSLVKNFRDDKLNAILDGIASETDAKKTSGTHGRRSALSDR